MSIEEPNAILRSPPFDGDIAKNISELEAYLAGLSIRSKSVKSSHSSKGSKMKTPFCDSISPLSPVT
jgi:hypothetical protein